MGTRIFDAGTKPESANAIKLANNMVLGAALVAQAEAFSLVRKFGVSPKIMYEVMADGLFAGAPAYKGYGQTMIDEAYDKAGSPVLVGLKDANLIFAAAELARIPLPTLNIYRDRLLGAIAHGDGQKDQAVLAREQARTSGGTHAAQDAQPLRPAGVPERRRGVAARPQVKAAARRHASRRAK